MVENTEPLPQEPASEDSASISGIGQSPVDQLLALLETEYVVLLTRLSAHVRSPDIAAEIIHDVYVKLRSEPAISEIHSPRAYLYTMAVNFAKNRNRGDWRAVNMGDEELLEIPDDAPDQQTAALALDEMNRAMDALHALPTRQRAIFLAKWRDEKLQSEIAAEFGLHKRSVQKELTRVELYLRKVLRRPKHPDR
jgi:RNA polymerase sigma-70 factor (ECF subfamily)